MSIWGRLMSAATTGLAAAKQDWAGGPSDPVVDALQALYLERWMLYDGSLFSDRYSPFLSDQRVYRNTRLLWKHYEAVVNFYAASIYQGDLSTDGKQLPDGTRGAIPIDPQVNEDQAKDLMTAIAELWTAWNWRQQMSLRPMYGAALGDVLTELVDDVDRGFVYPQVVWPGRVVAIELDYVGNVMTYALEYMVSETDAKGVTETYKYRKEVDKREFRYFKNGDPEDYYGDGPVVPNPYGFVPAIWDRHRIGAPGSVRGLSAADGTRQALLELNSIFSHGFDFQRKKFAMPIVIAGRVSKPGQSEIGAAAPPKLRDERWAREQRDKQARSQEFLETDNENTKILDVSFDVGKTLEMIAELRKGIEAENPEGRFYAELRSMTQVTAPGAERLMGDVKARVDLARAGYDMQTVKLLQMALSMCGFRANSGAWRRRPDVNGVMRSVELTRRQQAFLPFNLDTYHKGEMDFGISTRPLVIPTENERVELVALKESLQTAWGMEQAGMTPDEAKRVIREKQAAFDVVGDYGSPDPEPTVTVVEENAA